MSTEHSLAALEAFVQSLGADLYGWGDVAGIFAGDWGTFPRAISLAAALPVETMAPVAAGPTADYYQLYLRTNARLNEMAHALETWLSVLGFRTKAFPATVSASELNGELGAAMTAPVQHKTVAVRAGLGWIGKNALLITPQYGPRVRLASVFTDMPLPPAQPMASSRCGTCTRCVRACPAQALRGTTWQMGMARDELVDVEACKRTAERLLAQRAGQDDAVCGVCIAVCPFARLGVGSPP